MLMFAITEISITVDMEDVFMFIVLLYSRF